MNSFLINLTADKDTNYSLWKATKSIKRPITTTPLPIRKGTENWARENKEKADLFAEHLAEVFTPNSTQNIHNNLEEVNNIITEEITPVTPKEVAEEIKSNLNSKKAPGFDLITGQILKQLPRKGIVMLTYIINAAFRLKYVPESWKIAEVIMIPKPGKPPHEVKSYRPISLLPVISKIFEKLLFKRLKIIIQNAKLIPDHQFGFREKHTTIDQVHRITDVIEKVLEEKLICSALFLDVAQAFDKVWHEGLIYKLNKMLPKQYAEILTSYISDRLFRIKQEEAYSNLKTIQAGVPQGSVLGPILYVLYTSDLPKPEQGKIATFADDTALLTTGRDEFTSTRQLQKASKTLYEWTKKWRIKLNEEKSIHMNFTNKRLCNPPPLILNGTAVPYENKAKYLGMTLDTKLRWKEHVKKKKEELNIKFRQYNWLIGRKSSLSLYNKTLIYNQILKPTWLYGVQLWGCAKDIHIKTIQRVQNKILRAMVNAPWYIRNADIHRDLGIPTVEDEIKRFAKKHEERLHLHENAEVLQLLDNQHLLRRLKRTKPFELVL